MPADLIVYALVAAGLIFWLRSILGTRNGEERERPNPYLASEDQAVRSLPMAEGEKIVSMEEKIAKMAQGAGPVKAISGKTAELGLLEIVRADKSFDVDFFLDGAQDAFAMIVESYADGDRETLRNLLAPAVYAAFDQGIAAREARNERQVAEIHAIRRAEITDARLDGKRALVTVRFIADETSVTRNAAGEIVAGHPDKTTQMKDVWVFGRDVKSRDPSWMVHETRGDVDGDNETLPNAH